MYYNLKVILKWLSNSKPLLLVVGFVAVKWSTNKTAFSVLHSVIKHAVKAG